MGAAGDHLFGADAKRDRRIVGAGSRAQEKDDRIGRIGHAPSRATGEMDVDHAGGAAHSAAAQRRVGAHEIAAGGDPGRRRQARADIGRGRDRGAAGHMTTVLLTGFGPFPGAPFNPTGRLVERLVRLRRPALAGVTIVPHIFQTSYETVDRELPHLIATHKPDALLMFGLAPRAKTLRIETRARNALAILPDVSGQSLRRNLIVHGGPSAVTLPAQARHLFSAGRGARIPLVLSRDAGRYLCNYLCWRAAEASGQNGPRIISFIHVPPVARFAGRPDKRRRLTFNDLLRAGSNFLVAIAAAAGKRADRHV